MLSGLRKYFSTALSCTAVALSPPAMAQPGVATHIKTVFIILLENHNWTGGGTSSIRKNPAARYINRQLLPMSSYTRQYFNPQFTHPSLPNYLWLEAGTNFGILFNDGPPSQNAQDTTQHLVTLLSNAGISWKGYMESISGKVCPLVDEGALDPDNHPLYAVRHDPFVYFNDVTNDQDVHSANCIAHIRPYSKFAADLAAGTVAQYNWITPNVCHDMEDPCGGDPIAHADTWLSKAVPMIVNSAVFQQGGALFVTWDEAHSPDHSDGPIGMIVVSPFAKGGGYSNGIHYTHGSTLRTMQEIFGVTPLLGDAANQSDLRDLFTVFP